MCDYYLKILAENLKKFRIKNGYSRKELAEAVGVTSSYIWQIENAKKYCSIILLYKIAQLYQIKVQNFLEQ